MYTSLGPQQQENRQHKLEAGKLVNTSYVYFFGAPTTRKKRKLEVVLKTRKTTTKSTVKYGETSAQQETLAQQEKRRGLTIYGAGGYTLQLR